MTEGCGKSVWNGYNAGTRSKPLGGVISALRDESPHYIRSNAEFTVRFLLVNQ